MRERTNKDGTTTFQVLFRDGKKQRSKSFDTLQAARSFERDLEVLGIRRAIEALRGESEASVTLDEIAQAFFDFKVSRVRSPRTVFDYRRDYANWIQPEFGNRAASGIDESDVQAWVDRMHSATHADGTPRINPKTIAGHHALLHQMFKFAASPTRKLLPPAHNPCGATDLPARIKRPPKGLRVNAWLAMKAGLLAMGQKNGIGTDAADLGHFLVASGWRIGEAIALDESGCDDDGERITCYVLQVSRRQPDGTFKIVEDSKSRAGGRRVRLDADASAMLRRRILQTPRGGLVFRRGDAAWTYSAFRNTYWAGAAAIAQMPVPKIHSLRHTAVGVFHLSGASLAEIQRRIGHESIQTTIDVYGGMIDDMSDDSLDSVAAILRGERPQRPQRRQLES